VRMEIKELHEFREYLDLYSRYLQRIPSATQKPFYYTKDAPWSNEKISLSVGHSIARFERSWSDGN
ncbi:MAG TPA: hypothetical protein PKZ87_07320, partial [Sphaerochaeta sp.]|nr:hypothetical protein [Sphaerochaeta sp.]